VTRAALRGAALVLALAAVAALPACGRKSRPLAPELVRPEAPGDLSGISTPEGIRLSWLRPDHYSGGARMNDLGEFLIQRAPGEGVPPEFETVATLTLDDRFRFRQERRVTWTDPDVERGQRYLYRVVAVTLDNYRSAPAGPIAVRFGEPPAEEPSR
jgi:hypothetical protein